MTDIDDTVQHLFPAWRIASNYVLRVPIDGSARREQIWVRQIDDTTFEMCCIPFFLFDLALGDIFELDERHRPVPITESGRFVFRVWFGDTFAPRDESIASLKKLGATTERHSVNLLAIDACDLEQAHTIADYLHAQEEAGSLQYETGRSA